MSQRYSICQDAMMAEPQPPAALPRFLDRIFCLLSASHKPHVSTTLRSFDMPITFGSVGDIIAVCVLVKDCVDALSDTTGSAAQYQAVIRELHVLEKALLEVGISSRTRATTPELTSISANADATIEQCVLESDVRLWIRVAKLLKVRGDYMWRKAKKNGPVI